MGLCETTNLNWVGSPTLKYSLPFDVEQKPTQCQQAYRIMKKKKHFIHGYQLKWTTKPMFPHLKKQNLMLLLIFWS